MESIELGDIAFITGDGNPTSPARKGSIYVNLKGVGVADRMWINTDGHLSWTAINTND